MSKHSESKCVPISRPLSGGCESHSRLPIKPLIGSPLSIHPLQFDDFEEMFALDGSILSPLPIKSSISLGYEFTDSPVNEVDLSSSMKAKNEFMEIVSGNNNLYKNSFKRKNSSVGPKKPGLVF